MNERERRYFAPLICLFALAVLLVGYLLTEGRGVHFATHGVPQTEENTFSTADFLVCLDAGHGGADPGAVEVADVVLPDGKTFKFEYQYCRRF